MADIGAIFHRFVSAKSQSPDPTIVSKDEWNDGLTLSGGSDGQILSYDSSNATYKSAWINQRPGVSVKSYGAVGDGITNDRTAIQDCFDENKVVFFPEGTYYVGDFAANTNIIDLSALGDGITILTEGVVTLKCNTTFVTATPRFFYLKSNNDFYCDPIYFDDGAFDGSDTIGAIGFYLANDTTLNWGNCYFERITSKDMLSPIVISALEGYPTFSDVNRIRGIYIGQIFVNNCYYGFHTQSDGDSVFIGLLETYRTIRGYYVYGCVGHTVGKMYVRDPRPSTGHCYIARQVNSGDTRGIDIHLVGRDFGADFDTAPLNTVVAIDHIDLLGTGEISGITIDVDINNTVDNYQPVILRNYTGSGGSQTTDPSDNITRDIRLSGSCDEHALSVTSVATYDAVRQMNFISGFNFLPDQTIYNNFQLNQLARDQTPTWTASVNPAIGNGTLTYDIDIQDGLATVQVNLTAGSTTTFGTGSWTIGSFGLASKAGSQGTAYYYDSSANTYYVGACRISDGGSGLSFLSHAAVGLVGPTTPFTWADGDQLHASITFPVSGS